MEAWETRKHFESGAKCLIGFHLVNVLFCCSGICIYHRSQGALTSLAHS